MNFVKNGVELAVLDTIVSEIKDKFNKNIAQYVTSNPTPISAAAAAAQEETWINDLNEKYDERVLKTVGRKVPPNWKEGKDNVVVRKRILNRELNALKGKLFQAYDAAQAALAQQVSKQMADMTASSAAHMTILKTKLPMGRQALSTALEQHKASLITSVNDLYPGGLDKLEADSRLCNGNSFSAALSEALATSFEDMEAANDQALSELGQKLETLITSSKGVAETFKDTEAILLPVQPDFLSLRADTLRDRLKSHIEGAYDGGMSTASTHFTLAKGLDLSMVLEGLVTSTIGILLDLNARKSAEILAKVRATTMENIASQTRQAMKEIAARNVDSACNQLSFLSPDSLASFKLGVEMDASQLSF